MANSVTQEYMQIPAVTRAYTTACVLTTAAVQLELITPFQLYFNPDLILKKYQVSTVETCCVYDNHFNKNMATDHKLLVFWASWIQLLVQHDFSLFGLFANLFFLGQAFTIMLVYIWSRRNPYVRMNFFGLLNFQAPFLPWVLMGFSLLLGNSIVIDLLGIGVGHIYYFLEDVFPNQPGGRKLLTTPGIFRVLFDMPQEDPDYAPLPEDQSGISGQGVEDDGQGQNDEEN
ncbi:hypothetical protein cypCar_00001874 [Cyprinus carpio]|nr:hypothetical protein cypCar_00001874 [Cyprinus carpio]